MNISTANHCRLLKQVVCLFGFVIVCFSFAIASDVDTTKAKLIGKNFITPKIKETGRLKLNTIPNVQMQHAFTMYEDGKPLYYIFNFVGRTGFMIISAEDNVQPILGYSFENNFSVNDSKPDAFQFLLNSFTQQISNARKSFSEPVPEIKRLWNQYSTAATNLKSAAINVPAMETYSLPASVSPLMSTTWNQGCGWNNLCPVDAGGQCGRTWAGCVAISQSQVMKFWNYPASGEGSKSYNHYKYGLQSVNFGAATYNWGAMPNNSSNAEVAKLLYHVGVSVNMDYGITGSGAVMDNVASSLVNYFKYSTNITSTYKSGYTDANWENLIKTELYEGRPIPYAGGNHAFVLDGYQSGNYFHVNWGWSGSYDGYFYLNNLKPGSYDFTSTNCAIIGVMPKTLYPGIDVGKIKPLSCGIAFNDSTNDGDNRINKYKQCYLQATGKEKIYSISTTLTGRLKAKISGLGGKKLNLFLLNYPDKDSLLAYGDSSVYLDNAKPGLYYIAVDGLYGAGGKFSITVTCPNSNADLTIIKPSVSPYYIQPYHSNVGLKCWVKNIGHATAPASKLKFYYSEDNALNTGDLKIDSVIVGTINAGDSVNISKTVTMPAVTSGTRYVLFVADYNNAVTETDETDNIASVVFQGVPAGVMNCASAISLKSKVWYSGNTATQGDSIINDYSYLKGYTGKEVIHTFTASYNGIARIDFSEKVLGSLSCLVLSACNENLVDRQISLNNDTIASLNYVVTKNTVYYLVVDGSNRASGPYLLRVTLPDSCPSAIVSYADTSRCAGSGIAGLNAPYGYSGYQWCKNGFPILSAKNTYYGATEDGSYTVQITENGCTSTSNKINIKYSPPPSGASIAAVGDTTFCKGGSVSLNVTSAGGYTYNWTRDNIKIPGANSISYNAEQSGMYRAEVTNLSCTIKSNAKKVTVNSIAADIGDTVTVSATKLATWYPFTGSQDYTDYSGNANYCYAMNSYATYAKDGQYNRAVYLDGLQSYLTTSNKFNHPDTITLSLWFKSNTNKGGWLIGLGNQQFNSLSTSADRMIYMDNAGKLHFGVGITIRTALSSTLSYNDNNWHLATAMLSDKGMKLYVDTSLVDSKTSPTSGGAYLGYWRMGYDNLTGWPSKPDSAHFKGTIDEVRIYTRELTAAEIGLLFVTKKLIAEVIPDMICQTKGKSKVYIYNSEPVATYQLRNNAGNINIGAAIAGNGGTISMETDSLSATTSLNVLAKNLKTGCTHQLDTTFTVIVGILNTPSVSITTNAPGNAICSGTNLTFNALPINGGPSPTFQWQLNKAIAGGNSNTYSSGNLDEGDKVNLILTSNAKCLTTSKAYSDTITVKVTTVAIPVLSVKSADSLQASTVADHYEWYKNEVLLGVTDQTIQPASSGTYKVIAVKEGCKSAASQTLNFTITNTDIVSSNAETVIYPNPTDGLIIIEFTAITDDIEITVLHSDGGVIRQFHINDKGNFHKQINLSGNPKGVYLLVIKNKQFVKTSKIVLQ